jgi:metal-responsive CopG/Arc/MetJ family transcriptional regulator
MKESEKVSKFTISLEQDLFAWVEEQVKEINKKDRRAKSSRSAVIAHAVESMMKSEQGKSHPPATVGAKIVIPSETSDSGLLTRNIPNSRKTG